MAVYAPRFTSKDPQVAEWWKNQQVKSKSLEMAIKMLIQRFGTIDIYEAAMLQLLENSGSSNNKSVRSISDVFIKPEPQPKVRYENETKEIKTEVESKKDTPIDPRELIAAGEKKVKKTSKPKTTPAEQMNPEDILAMMGNQASSL